MMFSFLTPCLTRLWWKRHGVLVVIVLLALAIRLWGLDFGMPNLSRVDEQNISEYSLLRILGSCWRGACDFNPRFFEYPSLFIYLTTAAYAVFYTVGNWIGLFQSPGDFMALYGNDQTAFHLITRTFSAIFGALTVIPVALMAQRMANDQRWVGWLAGALLGACYLHVRDSHFGVTDVSAAFFVAWSLERASAMAFSADLPTVNLFQRRLLWAAVLAGLAGGMKYPAGLVLSVPLILIGVRFGRLQKKAAIRLCLFAVSLAAGVFFITTPFSMLDMHKFWESLFFQLDHMVQGHMMNLGKGWIYHARFSLWYGLQPSGFLLSVFTMAGFAGWCLLRNSHHRGNLWALHWAILIFALGFYLYLGNTPTVFIRYMMPLIPVFCLYQALGLWQIAQWLAQNPFQIQLSPRTQQIFMLGMMLLVLMPSLLMSVRCTALLATPDTRVLARRWLLEHLQPNDGVGIGMGLAHLSLPNTLDKYFLLPLSKTEPGHHLKGRGLAPSRLPPMMGKIINNNREYNLSSYRDPDTMRRLGIRYFALAVSPLSLFSTPAFELGPIEAMYPRVATFSPMNSGHAQPDEGTFNAIDAFYLPFATLDHVERPGPEIRIYQVP